MISIKNRRLNACTSLVVAEALGNACRGLLGPSQSIKCVVEADGTFEYVSNASRYLEAVKVDHPAICIIHDAISGIDCVCGTGCTTSLFFIGEWSSKAKSMIQVGIPKQVIIIGYEFIVERLAAYLKRLVHPLMKLFPSKPLSSRPHHRNVYSRYSSGNIYSIEKQIENLCNRIIPCNTMTSSCLQQICKNVAEHKSVEDICDLKIAKGSVFVDTLCGMQHELCVVPGLCFPITDKNVFALTVELLTNKEKVKMVVVDSWMLQTATRIYQNNIKGITIERQYNDYHDSNESIHNGLMISSIQTVTAILSSLKTAQISIIFISGVVDEEIIAELLNSKIIPMRINSHSKFKCLIRSLSLCSNPYVTIPQNYIHEVGVELIFQRNNYEDLTIKDFNYGLLNLSWVSTNEVIQTCVITDRTPHRLLCFKEKFQSAFHKLINILDEQCYLPGATETESMCINWLQRKKSDLAKDFHTKDMGTIFNCYKVDTELYLTQIINDIIISFEIYIATIQQLKNISDLYNTNIIDDVKSKRIGWKEACRILTLLVNCDVINKSD